MANSFEYNVFGKKLSFKPGQRVVFDAVKAFAILPSNIEASK